ncbi:MAG: pyrroline-5-carboxylate reductase [Oscillospiraceae bacterium]|nr:pyrroline-5-carboxylate reductase [Oscillospiraceae bacterium]
MKIGFIGAGNMGGAIIGGIIGNGIAEPADIIVSDINKTKVNELLNQYHIKQGLSNEIVAAAVDILFLCVKPNAIYSVIDEIKGSVKTETIIVSIVAGQAIAKLEAAFCRDSLKLVRVMPNTPSLVGEGMAAIVPNANADEDDTAKVLEIFNSFGKAEAVSEQLMDAVTAVSGSSPAYVFMFIEAMADAAVQGGMPRSQAYTFAAQAVLGSAKMVLETGKHPGELKDMVCSPAGTTIDAVAVLEEEGMRAAVIKAMKACIDKSKVL